jgi:hypothetical protein
MYNNLFIFIEKHETHIWNKIKTTENENNNKMKKWKKKFIERNFMIKILKKNYSVQSKNKLEISNLHTYKEKCKGGIFFKKLKEHQ